MEEEQEEPTLAETFGRVFTTALMAVIGFLAGVAFGERWQVMADTPIWWRISAVVVSLATWRGLNKGWVR
jgi:hypothetical protein